MRPTKGKSLTEVLDAPVAALAGVSEDNGENLAAAFGIKNVLGRTVDVAESAVRRWRVDQLGPAGTPLSLLGDDGLPTTRDQYPLRPYINKRSPRRATELPP
jgi:hypothetical protein